MSARKAFILIFFLALGLPALTQNAKPRNNALADNKLFHFGYSVGFNVMGFTINPQPGYVPTLKRNPGINFNIITDYRLARYLNLRFIPGIQFAQRNLNVVGHTNPWLIESIFLELPVQLKYRSLRANNYAPFLVAGINPRFDLMRRAVDFNAWTFSPPMLKAFDIYPELGWGVDFYLSSVKVGLELKFSVGLLNMFLVPQGTSTIDFDLYIKGIESIYSRMVILAINIE